MAKRTRVTIIVFALSVLLCGVGIVLIIQKILYPLAAFLVLLPLAANVILMIVYIILIACLAKNSNLSKTNRRKQYYVPFIFHHTPISS